MRNSNTFSTTRRLRLATATSLVALFLVSAATPARAQNIDMPKDGRQLLAACKMSHNVPLKTMSDAGRAAYCLGLAEGVAAMLTFTSTYKDPIALRRCVPGEHTGTEFAKDLIKQIELDSDYLTMPPSAVAVVAALRGYE